MAGLLGWRVLYGLVGPRHVRLAALARKLAAAPAWARTTLQALRTGDWNALAGAGRQGQNLALAGVIAALPLALAVLAYWAREWHHAPATGAASPSSPAAAWAAHTHGKEDEDDD
ncbi:MAG: hypothetical protein ACK4GB_08925 [Tepidimonas sp.]